MWTKKIRTSEIHGNRPKPRGLRPDVVEPDCCTRSEDVTNDDGGQSGQQKTDKN